MTKDKSVFDTLSALNVEKYTEKSNGKNYLTWSYAWAELKKIYPEATYEILKFDNIPYVKSDLGYMVYTTVTIGSLTHEMWLPVLDSKFKTLKDKPYTYETKKGKFNVNAASMFDVNKAIMRCLVKNLAMFGLGLYIYAGEDLPEAEKEHQEEQKDKQNAEKFLNEQIAFMRNCKDITALQNCFSHTQSLLSGKDELLNKAVAVKDEMKAKLQPADKPDFTSLIATAKNAIDACKKIDDITSIMNNDSQVAEMEKLSKDHAFKEVREFAIKKMKELEENLCPF